jgi:hypothetical protein
VLPIFLGDQRFIGRHRPSDAESGIAPQQAAIGNYSPPPPEAEPDRVAYS